MPAMNSFLEQGRGGVCDDEGASPLLYAAANGKDSVLRILLQVSLSERAYHCTCRVVCMYTHHKNYFIGHIQHEHPSNIKKYYV